jgi:hypothetical protein
MKIRDLLVIIFTAIVALILLGRAAWAGGSGAGGGSHEGTSSTGDGWSFGIGLVDWKCADTCASICRDRCVVACADSKDPSCVQACYPVCSEDCYPDCLGAHAHEPDPSDLGLEVDPVRLVTDVDGGAPSPPKVTADGPIAEQSLGCNASPGVAMVTLLNGLAAFFAIGVAMRHRRR